MNMAEIKNEIQDRISNNGAICLHNPNDANIAKTIDELKSKAVSLDMANPTNEQMQQIVAKSNSVDTKTLVNLENVFQEGLTNNRNTVVNLLKNRTMPNGAKLPDNAVLLMTTDIDMLSQPEANDNMLKNAEMLEATLGRVVKLPNCASIEESNAVRNEIVGAFNESMNVRTREIGSEMVRGGE